jgi:peptidoglycan/LPS O-acetylase OafA/YrhL
LKEKRLALVETGLEVSRSSERARFYVPQIDMLRFAAFVMVFVFHSLPQTPAPYLMKGLSEPLASLLAVVVNSAGYGVDLFFVISSYLITRLLLAELAADKTLDVKAFYIRRALRIWPLYYTFLIVGFIIQRILSLHALSNESFISFLVFLGNWGLARNPDGSLAFGILWSLCVEEQFYLIWPLILSRFTLGAIPVITAGMIAVAICSRLVLAGFDVPYASIWTITLSRLDPIAMGVLLAIVPRKHLIAPLLALLLAILCLPALSYLNITLAPRFGLVLGFTGVAFICALVVAAVVDSDPIRVGVLGRGIVYLGKISFGLYVFHAVMLELALAFLPSASGTIQLLRIALALFATIAAAMLSYAFLEKPFLRLKERFTYVHSRPV